MKAIDFANIVTGGTVNFGVVSRQRVVENLRELAVRIERNETPRLALQNAYSADKVNHDDYLYTILVLEFAEIHPHAPIGTELHGTDKLPVEVK